MVLYVMNGVNGTGARAEGGTAETCRRLLNFGNADVQVLCASSARSACVTRVLSIVSHDALAHVAIPSHVLIKKHQEKNAPAGLSSGRLVRPLSFLVWVGAMF